MPNYKVYQASGDRQDYSGNVFADFPGGGRPFRVPRLTKYEAVLTFQVKVLASSWETKVNGDDITAGFSAYFPAISSCLSCCYYYLKPQLDIVDYMVAHHANCGKIEFVPNDSKYNIHSLPMDRVRY